MSSSAPARRARWIALALAGGIWLLLLAAGLEAWARWQVRQADLQVREVENRLYSHPEWTEKDQAVARQVLGGWPDTDADLRAWRELLNHPPQADAWKKRADPYGEIFLFLDTAGRVLDRVTPDPAASPVPQSWLDRLSPGAVIFDALPPDCRQDAAAALRAAPAGNQIREYPIPLQDHAPPEVLQFVWLPAAAADRNPSSPHVLCVIRLSIWQELWLTFRPNIHHQDIMDFRSNSLGWRNDEVMLPRPPGTYRIVCVGGSTTAEGPHNALTYPSLLDRHLRLDHPDVEVVNAGIFAIGSYGEAQHAADYLALDPSLFLHYNFVNDVVSVLDHAEAAEAVLSPRRLLRRLAGYSTFIRRYLDLWTMPSEAALLAGLHYTFANMDSLRRAAEQQGVPVAFCSFARPAWETLSPPEKAFFDRRIRNMIWGPRLTMRAYCRLVDLYNRELRIRCTLWKAPFLDIAPRLSGGIDRYTDICHMRLWAVDDKARVIAEQIAPLIAGADNSRP